MWGRPSHRPPPRTRANRQDLDRRCVLYPHGSTRLTARDTAHLFTARDDNLCVVVNRVRAHMRATSRRANGAVNGAARLLGLGLRAAIHGPDGHLHDRRRHLALRVARLLCARRGRRQGRGRLRSKRSAAPARRSAAALRPLATAGVKAAPRLPAAAAAKTAPRRRSACPPSAQGRPGRRADARRMLASDAAARALLARDARVLP